MARRSARGWLLEVSLAVVATLLGLFFLWQSVGEGDGAPLPLEAAAGVLSFTGLVLFRRSHPVGLTLGLIPFGILLGMPMGATPIALFSVALHRPARVTIALAGLHAACVATVYGLVMGLTREYYESVAFVVLLHVSLVAVAMVIRAQRQLVAAWAERARQAEEGQRLRIEQARLAERERIAREMHDVLAHRVSLLALHAGALEVRREASAEEREAAGVIRRGAHDALEDLRMLLGMLRAPAEDRPQPTLDDVPELVERSRWAGADICFTMTGLRRDVGPVAGEDAGTVSGEDAEVPDQTGRHAYRIIQEALTNALKHAPGAPVRVNVDVVRSRGLDVRVDNDLVRAGSHGRRPGNHAEPIPGAGAEPIPGGGAEPIRGAGAEPVPGGGAEPIRGAGAEPVPGAGAEPIPGGGAEPIPGAGAGLAGLRERVRLVGGRIEHGPTPTGEFNVRAWLPWQT